MTEVTAERVQEIADGMSSQGDGYWLTNYAEPKRDGTDLDNAMVKAIDALYDFNRLLEKYMKKFDVEWS